MIKWIVRASAMTHYWTEFEKGKLTYDEAIAAFVSTDPEIKDELFKACDSVSGIMGKYDYTEGWIGPLKEAGYKLLMSRYDLKAEECVFIDDTEENVRSAEALGMAGIVFTGYEDAAGKLAVMCGEK
ncbi:MAG: HAD family hydrolase [Lachnospiraceae bacterium]|nr:HAD family hydrolase [Lachnospiraceae bacterium]